MNRYASCLVAGQASDGPHFLHEVRAVVICLSMRSRESFTGFRVDSLQCCNYNGYMYVG